MRFIWNNNLSGSVLCVVDQSPTSESSALWSVCARQSQNKPVDNSSIRNMH